MNFYKVEDPVTKKNKVVHRTFILPVNFCQSDTESTVLSTLSYDKSDMVEPDPKEAPRHVDDQRTAAWVLQTEGSEIQPHDVSRADAQRGSRQNSVGSRHSPTDFPDADLDDDVENPSEQWSECIQSEDALSNTTVSSCTLSGSSSSLDCLRPRSSVESSVNVKENDTGEEDNSVKIKGQYCA